MIRRRLFTTLRQPILWSLLAAWLLAACSGTYAISAQDAVPTPTPGAATEAPDATPLPGNLDRVTFTVDDRTYTIRQLLPRDGIPPIYDPTFVSPDDSGYSPDELVMGLEINGDARAYPVGVMRRREMLNDVVGGTPVLVTW